MKETLKVSEILKSPVQLGPFPMEKLRRVEQPTNLITDDVRRIDQREIPTARMSRGDYGKTAQVAYNSYKNLNERGDPLTESMQDVIGLLSAFQPKEIAKFTSPVTGDPEILSRHIKSLGYFLGADVMGICRLPKSAIYSHDSQGNPVNLNYTNALVIVTRKDHRTMHASTGHDWVSDPISLQAYQQCAVISQTIAGYIRRLGYPAQAQHKGLYCVMIPPLLLWAGIGEVSRLGIILNPFLGLGFKASAVLTDMPLIPDKPVDFGLQDFCRKCKKCSELCPSRAISTSDKVMYNGYETWKVNEQRCASFMVLNKNAVWCNNCVKVCPWTQPATWPHKIVRWGVMRSSLARSLAIFGDRISGHARANNNKKWWFDLYYKGGVLEVPETEESKID